MRLLAPRSGSRCLWPSGVGDDDLIAAAVQDRCYGGGPGLAVSWLHGDVCANEIRRQRGGIAEVDGAPGAGFQVVGTPSWERGTQDLRGSRDGWGGRCVRGDLLMLFVRVQIK